MGCRNLSKFGTISIQFLYLPWSVVKWWDKILRYSVSVFPVLMLQESSICIRFIISAALPITGGWDAIAGHFEGSSRDWPTNRDHDNWSLMVTENHTKAWNDDRAVMTLQIVICNSCWCKASSHCGGNANATRRERRAWRFGCSDAVKATRNDTWSCHR